MYGQGELVTDASFDLRVLARSLRIAEQAGNMRLYEALLRHPIEIVFGVQTQKEVFGIHVIEMAPQVDHLDDVQMRRALAVRREVPHYRDIEHQGRGRYSLLRRNKNVR